MDKLGGGGANNFSCGGQFLEKLLEYRILPTLNFFFLTFDHQHSSALGLGSAVVHALARRAFLSFSLSVWMEPVPQNISSLVIADLLAPL